MIRLRGTALHLGTAAEVTLAPTDGPIVVAQRGARALLDELRPVRTDRGVTVATSDGRVRIDLVEHLLSAIGGLGIGGGVRIETDDDELPLLDGGAARFAVALADHEVVTPRLRIARAATLGHGRSTYRFAPGRGRRLRVRIDFPAPVGEQDASWDGDPADFSARIAPARTFGWAHEYATLRAEGRAGGADLASVLVFDERGVVPGCRAGSPDEPARHKLLDLIGDLALYGGPPLGSVDADRPGHTATHAAVAEAFATGVLVL